MTLPRHRRARASTNHVLVKLVENVENKGESKILPDQAQTASAPGSLCKKSPAVSCRSGICTERSSVPFTEPAGMTCTVSWLRPCFRDGERDDCGGLSGEDCEKLICPECARTLVKDT